MEENFDHKKIEKSVIKLWEESNIFSPSIEKNKKSFSMFLTPPNASGPMHIGNAIMVALQDILARYHRANGEPTLWIPSTDHGGYETQVSFERELEKNGEKLKNNFTNKELFSKIEKFVEANTDIIKNQLKALGASVDWSCFRFTMDKESLLAVDQTFKKLVEDNLIYRRSYMVSYCSLCSTFLADIELKEIEKEMPLYHIKFAQNNGEHVTLSTTRPEFLFSVSHVLVHPNDKAHSQHIGKTLINPVNGQPVEVISSKRKFYPEKAEKFLFPFCPSFKRYDYEYTLRNTLPSRNLLDWQGNLIEQYPGLSPIEARAKEVALLEKNGCIEAVDNSHLEPILFCKKGHATENLIVFTWFLSFDDEKNPLRKPAIKAIEKEHFTVFPAWRKKGLVEWMEKMHDWPIARQNVWGIKIPIWYDVSEPEHFMVWFINKKGEKLNGNLGDFLKQGISLEEITERLERIYAGEKATWTLKKIPDKSYLPETDTFDTWFSSGQWATIVFGQQNSPDFSRFYPSDSIVIGQDLLRLSVSRKILLSFYATKQLPFKLAYLHPLLKGPDGQKMSKSVGNVASIEYYLEKFGADATRMALVASASFLEDFYFSEDALKFFKDFTSKLWKMGKFVNVINEYNIIAPKKITLSPEDEKILSELDNMIGATSLCIEKYLFSSAQEKICSFLEILEKYTELIKSQGDAEISLFLIHQIYEKYLIALHPFMPFITEELYKNLYQKSPLASVPWPQKNKK